MASLDMHAAYIEMHRGVHRLTVGLRLALFGEGSAGGRDPGARRFGGSFPQPGIFKCRRNFFWCADALVDASVRICVLMRVMHQL